MARLFRVFRVVRDEFGGWVLYFRRQGVLHGLRCLLDY